MIRPNYMFNPWKFGLMNGAADMFSGMAHGLQMQMVLNNRLAAYHEKYAQMANLAKLREQHNVILAAWKREQELLKPVKRKFTDLQDGVSKEETYHYEVDPNTQVAHKVSDGIVPLSQPETQADRIQLEKMRQQGAAARISALRGTANDGSKSEFASRRSLQAAMDKFEGNLANPVRRDDVLKAEGINPDDPGANQKYLTKKEEETRRRLRLPTMAEDNAGADSGKASNKQGWTAPNGQFYENGTSITNNKDGRKVTIVNGKPVADTANGADANSVAVNGGEASAGGDEGNRENDDDDRQTANDPEPPQSIDLSDPNMPVQGAYLKMIAENPDLYPPAPSSGASDEVQNGPGLMDAASDGEDDTRDDAEDRQMLGGGLMENAYV